MNPRHWTKPHFIGDVETRWLHERGDDRRMQLLAPFAFYDRHGVLWEAPKDWIVDGASIPRLFWRLCDPFIGDYRLASVVHDVACDQKTRPWQQVHRMFYEAMLCARVPKWKARLMYAAVYTFGPRWPAPIIEHEVGTADQPRTVRAHRNRFCPICKEGFASYTEDWTESAALVRTWSHHAFEHGQEVDRRVCRQAIPYSS